MGRSIQLAILVFSALVIATGLWRTLFLFRSLEDEEESFLMGFYGLHPMMVRYDFERNTVTSVGGFLPESLIRVALGM